MVRVVHKEAVLTLLPCMCFKGNAKRQGIMYSDRRMISLLYEIEITEANREVRC